MCVLLYKKSRNGCKSIFHECDKTIKHFAKKSFSVFKNVKNSSFEHTKTFFGEIFYNFFIALMKNSFATISCVIIMSYLSNLMGTQIHNPNFSALCGTLETIVLSCLSINVSVCFFGTNKYLLLRF